MVAINRQRTRRYRGELIMYKARADAVSGTRVYAGGKWLQCIGNKNVSVGEYVWTDGRCVYGHLQESEQPKVITVPQEEEGVPLVRFSDETTKRAELYTFEKKRVRKVAEIHLEDGTANVYKVVGDELVFSHTLPNADAWTNYNIFINDDKKNSWLYDNGTHYKENFYKDAPVISNEARNFWTDTELIACNVDNKGNRFDMVTRYKSFWFEDEGSKQIEATAVDILKNGEVVQSVKLEEIFADIADATPNSEPLWTPSEMNACWVSVSTNSEPMCAFIEDERTWAFWFNCWCTKETGFNDDPPIDTEETGWEMHSGVDKTSLWQLRLITADEQKIILQANLTSYATVDLLAYPQVEYDVTVTTNHTSHARIPLQDGYYCTVSDIFTASEALGHETTALGDIVFGSIKHFSPRDKELFSGIFPLPYTAQICKVGNKYLFNNTSDAASFSFLGDDVFESGLFLITKNTRERIGKAFSNERLRPMKKIKSWYKRIQPLEIEQQEI